MDDEEDGVEDKDDTDFEPDAAFAHPIKRKQKKGLDFSKWRELVTEDYHPVNQKTKMDPSLLLAESGEGMGVMEATEYVQGDINSSLPVLPDTNPFNDERVSKEPHPNSNVGPVKSPDSMAIASGTGDSVLISDLEHHHLGSLPVQEFPKDDGFVTQNSVSNKFPDGQRGSLSFMDDIDAENDARVQNMSREEIAQAQAEIMDKMSPGMVEMLKRRGLKKLVQKSDKSDLDTGHQCTSTPDATHLPQDSEPARPFKGGTANNSSMAEAASTENTSNRPDNGGRESSTASDSSSWNLWTERVEKIRASRFSLDGSVVDGDSIQMPLMSKHS